MPRPPVAISRHADIKFAIDPLAGIIDEPGFDVGCDAVPVPIDIGSQFRLGFADTAQIARARGSMLLSEVTIQESID